MTDPALRPPVERLIGRAFLHRELVFVLILSAGGVAAFLGTRALADSTAAIRRSDARAWYARGHALMAAGDTSGALRALRRSARIDPTNRDVSFTLAAALRAAGQPDEAAQVLTSLRDSRPDDPKANIELARLVEAGSDFARAARHYQDALDAMWMPEAAEQSRAIRTEFIRALLDHGERARALAQTLVLAADLPDRAADQVEAGRLFLAAGDARRALERFSAALVAEPQNSTALAGAGEAWFDLGDYERAGRNLTASGSLDERVVQMRQVAGLTLSADPLAPRLGRQERIRRINRVLAVAKSRLDACAPADGDSNPERSELRRQIAALAESDQRQVHQDDRDRGEDAVELAIRVDHAAVSCEPPDAFSRAVTLIAREHGLEGLR
jgi:tetratricopeptide (TPR) repeat protein